MYNIVIFSGGTGSIAVQEGLATVYGTESYNLDVIINAYDNGKSTGICRKIFNGGILGPSDLRKNHMTQFRIQKAGALKDLSSKEAALYKIFNLRLDAVGKEDCYGRIFALLGLYKEAIGNKTSDILKSLLDYFFFEDASKRVWRTTLEGVVFRDFSVGNVFYSASAAVNGCSLRLAGREMAGILGIKDNIHLISDVSLYLEAETESGKEIRDEGMIVEWDDPDDKIASVALLKDGKEYIPSVDEGTDLAKVRSCRDIIASADIIIFSPGTQWSSLIPTYMHSGMRKMLSTSHARKYIVMNTVEDRDMKGVPADRIIDILGRYVPLDNFTAVVNLDAVPGMNHVSRIRSIYGHISGGTAKHDPVKLIAMIMKDFFGVAGFHGTFIYDLDGTIWDERADSRGKAVGAENMNLFKGIIHSGNNYEHVRDVFRYLYYQNGVTEIYSDFGNIYFTTEDNMAHVLCKEYVVEPKVASELEKISEFRGKVRSRGYGCVVTVKPLANREELLRKAQEALKPFGDTYEARISGHTSIDIMRRDYGKKAMLREIIKRHALEANDVIFVGNETETGAEADIRELGVKTIQIDDVYECNVLLRTVNALDPGML